jgi:hypothetical protein
MIVGMLYIVHVLVVLVIININIQNFHKVGMLIKIEYTFQKVKYNQINFIQLKLLSMIEIIDKILLRDHYYIIMELIIELEDFMMLIIKLIFRIELFWISLLIIKLDMDMLEEIIEIEIMIQE